MPLWQTKDEGLVENRIAIVVLYSKGSYILKLRVIYIIIVTTTTTKTAGNSIWDLHVLPRLQEKSFENNINA